MKRKTFFFNKPKQLTKIENTLVTFISDQSLCDTCAIDNYTQHLSKSSSHGRTCCASPITQENFCKNYFLKIESIDNLFKFKVNI